MRADRYARTIADGGAERTHVDGMSTGKEIRPGLFSPGLISTGGAAGNRTRVL
ncbi:MAG: hypothetical protein QOK45_1898, partial [Mycobacterium sp.]|nr:hypothetical protein [Mycobacterium sp.]